MGCTTRTRATAGSARWHVGLLFLGLGLWLVCPVTARGERFDATALAAPGSARLLQLQRSPAAHAPSGLRLALSNARPFVGSRLRAAALDLQWVGRRSATALALRQLRSPVHRHTRLVVAFQHRRPVWRIGVHARLESMRFEPARPGGHPIDRRRLRVRAGAGVGDGGGPRLVTHVTLAVRGHGDPVLAVAAALPLSRALEIVTAYERRAGLSPDVHVAAVVRAPPFGLRAGHDIATQAMTAGLSITTGRWTWSWGTESHPELGWSHAWTCEVRR